MNTITSTMDTTEGKPALPLLRRGQAAAYVRANWGIPCAARTLAKLMTTGGGPLVRKAGRIPLNAHYGLFAITYGNLVEIASSESAAAELYDLMLEQRDWS